MINLEIKSVLVFSLAFFSALLILPKLQRIAWKIGLLDFPNERKMHTKPKPLVGGIGIVISMTFSALLFVPLQGMRGFFSGLALLLLVGFLDDFNELGHRQKFLGQIGAALLLIYYSNVYVSSFGNLIGMGDIILAYRWLAYPVTIFCIVGVINSINLIDGLDGLAGGISLIAFLFFALHAAMSGNANFILLNLAFVGALLGFLRYNWTPSSLFLGDAGSLCLGFSLTFVAIDMSQGTSAIIRPVHALLILAVPITDTLTVLTKRSLQGRNPFLPDKYHLHHIFMRYGFSKKNAVNTILVISLLLGGLSLLGPIYSVDDKFLFLVYILYFSFYFISSFFILKLYRNNLKWRKKMGWYGERD